MKNKMAVAALALAVAIASEARADGLDVKEWYLVCTRHIAGPIADLAKAGDQTEADTLSKAAGDLCGDPTHGYSPLKIRVAGEDGPLVRLRIEMWGAGVQTVPGIVIGDRWTPRWNLTEGDGQLAAREKLTRERREKVKTKACRDPNAPASWGCDPDRPQGNETCERGHLCGLRCGGFFGGKIICEVWPFDGRWLQSNFAGRQSKRIQQRAIGPLVMWRPIAGRQLLVEPVELDADLDEPLD